MGFEGKYSILIKFRTSSVYDEVCELHHGRTYDVPTGEHVTKVKVIDVSTYSVKVTMKNVPFELSNTQLERVLKCYGSVEKITTNMNDEDEWFQETIYGENCVYEETQHTNTVNITNQLN